MPVGLWLIGFNGMIDIITRESTFRLGATPKLPGPSKLVLIDPQNEKPIRVEQGGLYVSIGARPRQ